MRDISDPIIKVDSHEKISGVAIYVSDIDIPGMLHARTIRSTIPKGKIKSISIPELPKGYHKIDYRDIPGNNFVKIIFDDQPVFPIDKVTYIGEPILLLVGPDKEVLLELS
ncbi:MAG: aldehyde oxidase, partial [Bacilli bacterium]|nr:aldehyde oxidase [Bacilli bacterium]